MAAPRRGGWGGPGKEEGARVGAKAAGLPWQPGHHGPRVAMGTGEASQRLPPPPHGAAAPLSPRRALKRRPRRLRAAYIPRPAPGFRSPPLSFRRRSSGAWRTGLRERQRSAVGVAGGGGMETPLRGTGGLGGSRWCWDAQRRLREPLPDHRGEGRRSSTGLEHREESEPIREQDRGGGRGERRVRRRG